MGERKDVRYLWVTCGRCGVKKQCTPDFDYYETPLWPGEGLVCENCMEMLVSEELRRKPDRTDNDSSS